MCANIRIEHYSYYDSRDGFVSAALGLFREHLGQTLFALSDLDKVCYVKEMALGEICTTPKPFVLSCELLAEWLEDGTLARVIENHAGWGGFISVFLGHSTFAPLEIPPMPSHYERRGCLWSLFSKNEWWEPVMYDLQRHIPKFFDENIWCEGAFVCEGHVAAITTYTRA